MEKIKREASLNYVKRSVYMQMLLKAFYGALSYFIAVYMGISWWQGKQEAEACAFLYAHGAIRLAPCILAVLFVSLLVGATNKWEVYEFFHALLGVCMAALVLMRWQGGVYHLTIIVLLVTIAVAASCLFVKMK